MCSSIKRLSKGHQVGRVLCQRSLLFDPFKDLKDGVFLDEEKIVVEEEATDEE